MPLVNKKMGMWVTGSVLLPISQVNKCNAIWIPEFGKFLVLESILVQLQESRISLTIAIQNPHHGIKNPGMSWIIIYVANRGTLELNTKAKRDLDLATCTPRAPHAHPFRTQWPLRMFTSDKQISPPSLVLKLKRCQVLYKWIPKAEKLNRIFTPKECKCEEFCLKTRLDGEICSSDVIMHKGHFLLSNLGVSYTRQDVMKGETADWDRRLRCFGSHGITLDNDV